MPATQSGGTRGRLLSLLCAGDRTVAELAGELGITANATRAHLRQLEEDGLVSHRSVRRGVGKPPHEYTLTELGSVRLSRAYVPLLAALLEAAEGGVDAAGEEALLRAAGLVLARRYATAGGGAWSGVEGAVRVLEDSAGRGR